MRNQMKYSAKVIKSKKAMDIITGIIMVLVVIGVLLIIVAQMLGSLKGSIEERLCFANALQNAAIKTPGAQIAMFELTNCPIINVDVTTKDLTKDSSLAASYIKKYDQYFTDKSTINYNANKIVAEQMRSCWSKLGEGGLELFNKWNGFTEKKRKCVICSIIRFNQDAVGRIAQENKGITTITSLREWLKNNQVLGKTPKISYFEYFKDPDYEYDTPDLLFGDFKYDVSTRNAVVFIRITDTSLEAIGKFVYNLGAGGLRLLGSNVENKGYWSIDRLNIIPYTPDALANNCDQKMN